MYYKFGSSQNDIINVMDDEEVYKFLKTTYSTIPTEEFEKQLKLMVKDRPVFNQHVSILEITKEEYISSLARLFPDMFNFHLIKYIKLNYLNKETDKFMRL